MKNMKLKRVVLMLTLMVMSISAVTGGTIAWFTDSVTSNTNVISAGNLDVELYKEGNVKVNKDTKLFTLPEPSLWEPGAVTWENLTVANEGNLNMHYTLAINVTDENTVDGNGLSTALKMKVVEGGVTGTTREQVMAEAAGGTSLKTGKQVGTLAPDKAKTYGVIIYWEPGAEDNKWNVNNGKQVNDYAETGKNYLHITLGVKLEATQLDAEEDSFGPDYDEDAKYTVNNAADLQEALNKGGKVVLANDIALDSGVSLKVPAGVTATLNLNGKTINGGFQTGSSEKHVYAVENRGTLTLEGNGVVNSRGIGNYGDLTINSGTYNSIDTNGGGAVWNYAGKVTINGGTFTAADDTTAPGPCALNVVLGSTAIINGGKYIGNADQTYAILNAGTLTVNDIEVSSDHGVISSSGTVVLNGGKYTQNGNLDQTSSLLYNTAGKATINGGTYNFNVGGKLDSGLPVYCAGGNVEITGGTFTGYVTEMISSWGGSGTASVTGGTFTKKPDYVANGYVATQNSNGTWTVSELVNPWYDVYEVKAGNNIVITSGIVDEYAEIAHSGGNLTLKNVTFKNGLTIYTNNTENNGTVTLENCTIYLNNGTGDPDYPSRTQHKADYGLNLNLVNGSNMTFEFKNCTFTAADGHTYTADNSYNAYIGGGYSAKSIAFTGCTFEKSGKHGIGCSSEASSQYYALEVTGCRFIDWNNNSNFTNGAAIRGNLPSADFAANITISGNTFGENNGSTQTTVAIDSWTGNWN